MTWILTHSGRRFNLVNPTAAMISPLDISHALSNLCRFNGHTRTHYSVAQHSLTVSSLVPDQYKLVALLHDATEAYIGDMTRPLKALMPGFRMAEETIWRAICDRFNLDPVLPECVIRADLVALATERRDLMPIDPAEWECLRGVPAMPETITPLSAPEAYMQYFSRLMELMQSNHRRACA
ncbi:phosphohydrolase [Pseudomonas bananamidigenes]|uniref:phosphohydrolase n=1 Tax=Pseudomonas bananamidigenes TaxID=2843610 RepID=UPI0008036127|nr:phosphohydrolase [Pseudomonas bananamidigenes]